MPDPTSWERFTDRAVDYARHRPAYPEEILHLLETEIGFTSADVVADLGSGTGILTELLLAHGNTVYAVEPNPSMAALAEERLATHPGFRSVRGSAESTGLPAASIDLAAAGQAFHWFDPQRTRVECRRVTRPPHRVMLVWNRRRTEGRPFLREYESLIEKWADEERRRRRNRPLEPSLRLLFGSDRYARHVLSQHQELDAEGLLGRCLSSSYVPPRGSPGEHRMLEELKRLFERHQRGGLVRMEYDTELYLGTLG